MRSIADASAPCAFLAELVALLGEPATGHARPGADTLAGRLDRLEADAGRHGAPEATIAAIGSARALLRLAEAPILFVTRASAVR